MRFYRLGYATNVHPGEGLEDVLAAVAGPMAQVRQAFVEDAVLGVELWLSRRATAEIRAEGIERLEEALDAAGCRCFSLNAFPYGDFHSARVKEAVFRPSWLDPARLEYTREAARILAALLPEGGAGAISTSPGTFKPDASGTDVRRAFARALLEAVVDLDRIRRETGRTIRLAVEPEPMGLIETTDEAVTFFAKDLREEARELFRTLGTDEETARRVVDRHAGLCFDCCHIACQWEDPALSLARLREAGVPVHKMHLSSALVLPPPADDPAALERARALDDRRYLHQVVARGPEGLLSWADVADIQPANPPASIAHLPLRVHFHVPIHEPRAHDLETTQGALAAAIRAAVEAGDIRDLVVETYTWNLLAADAPADGLPAGIARELAWARARIEEAGGAVA